MTWKIILCAFLLLFIGTIDLDAQTVVLPPTPSIIRKASSVSTGSVASLFAGLFATSPGNSIIVCVGVGNGTAPTVTDTQGNTFIQATQIANGTAFNVAILYTTKISGGPDVITVNNGGTTASIAMEVYEVSGLIALQPQVLDDFASNTSAAA